MRAGWRELYASAFVFIDATHFRRWVPLRWFFFYPDAGPQRAMNSRLP